MATTNILLREDVENLGARGEIVRVKAGYARNYLLPRKLAVQATAGNVKQIEAERAALLKKEARERSTAEAQSAQMGGLRLNFERKVGEHGLLYGSVTSMHVADALKEKGYEIDRRRVHLPEPIKETGEFTVAVRLHRDVTVDIPVTVTGEGGAQTTAAAAATAAEATPEAPAAAENAGDADAAPAETTEA
ncbi:MAG: large subunit ribosomal protein [Acidobacteriota bacterium]|jgi:large subunit ribosomal protein L9|nr:large subunit ribosomal protein [Acidobacteriota bacterium]